MEEKKKVITRNEMLSQVVGGADTTTEGSASDDNPFADLPRVFDNDYDDDVTHRA